MTFSFPLPRTRLERLWRAWDGRKDLTNDDRMSVMNPQPAKPSQSTGKLATLSELADIFGVTKHSAWVYSNRADFPPPFDVLEGGRTRVWKRATVEKWGERFLPLPVGRPPAKRKRKKG
jgi:predicted DNA-binding transcriptional regulator AlpA